MSMEGWLGFILAGFALAGSPGPSNLSLSAIGAAFGARKGLAFVAGIVAGLIVVMAITGTGAMAVVLAVPGATPVVLAAVALYFAYLAFRIATAPPLGESDPNLKKPSFAGGAFLSLVNPKGYAAFAALFSGFVLVPERPTVDLATKAAVLVVIITIASLVWLYGGTLLTRFFRDPRSSRILNVTMAILLLASLAVALLL
jgi:threonine/homoserine/homoserine lactone efflux protein